MNRNLLFMAVSATFGVTALSLWGAKYIYVLLLFCLYLFYRFRQGKRILLLYAAAFLLFAAAAYHAETRNVTGYQGDERLLQVTFTGSPDIDGNQLRAVIQSETKEKIMLRYTIHSEEEKQFLQTNFKMGMTCPSSGRLTAPEPNRNENSFNYQSYLHAQHIHWIWKADNLSFSACMKPKKTLGNAVRQYRYAGLQYVYQHFPEDSAGFAAALIFGDQKMIDEKILSDYQKLGLVHLLAISGLHVSFLTGMLFFLCIRFGITREKTMLLMVCFLPMYMILSGGAPSVVRSGIMAMVFFIVSLQKKSGSAAGILAAVYMLMLLYNPFFIYQVGFQLSFAVTFSIILSLPIIGRYSQKTAALLVISAVCQLAAMPLLVYHFFEVSFLGVFLNILFVPVYSAVLLPMSMLSLLLHVLSPALGNLIILLLDKAFAICNAAAGFVSDLPLSSVVLGRPVFLVSLLLPLLSIRLLLSWEMSGLKNSNGWSLLLCLLLLFQYGSPLLSSKGEVHFIDVGQGDAILIRLPHNQGNYLIDTGGQPIFDREEWEERTSSFSTGDDTIIPLLKSKGIRHLDRLILTHADQDHIGGAADLLDQMKVKEVMVGKGSEMDYRQQDFMMRAVNDGIPITAVKKDHAWTEGDAKFYVLNPAKRLSEEKNESSIVILAQIGGISWLFTGDAGTDTEREMLQSFPQLKADVLKVGHHGSKTSTSEELLQQLQPQAAIISAGKGNRYGHPHSEVTEALERSGFRIFRTDRDGAVIYTFEKQTGTFKTVLP
ncbi:DNA internalization-related competence protein ComEC/Rec2 [Bacillus massiliglaciei]|uniref:DNA internalization-related competence protein ComEC/Rec2 n=1 Tax=Bacillus massiliglaciei TaxID=1816693 RepID=UPI000A9428EE|nr:DNA internalization-related competence protein ComEC/Rec2 [Bacillus massiliglaciei]